MSANTVTKTILDMFDGAKPDTLFFPEDLVEYGGTAVIHTTFSHLVGIKKLVPKKPAEQPITLSVVCSSFEEVKFRCIRLCIGLCFLTHLRASNMD